MPFSAFLRAAGILAMPCQLASVAGCGSDPAAGTTDATVDAATQGDGSSFDGDADAGEVLSDAYAIDSVVTTSPDTAADSTAQIACSRSLCAKKKGAAGLCLIWQCDGVGICKKAPAKDDSPCDDGDLCTGDERCKAGKCAALTGAGLCLCTATDVSACWAKLGLDKTDKCSAQPLCESYQSKDQNARRCVIKAGSAVTCDSSKGGFCTENTCNARHVCCERQDLQAERCGGGITLFRAGVQRHWFLCE